MASAYGRMPEETIGQQGRLTVRADVAQAPKTTASAYSGLSQTFLNSILVV